MTRLRELREKYGYTQDYVAEAIKISRITYVRYEMDMRNVRAPELQALADLYHVSVDYLLGRGDNKETQPTVKDDDELRAWAIRRVSTLSDPALARVRDFLAGLEAGQEIGAAPAADPDPGGQSSQ
ncbi:MAG: helix-turn-helix domain-containing protein [bacterium]